jgi:predicted nucleic acid-binding protein
VTVYFADSNAIAKRYITERGSGWIRKWADPSEGNLIILSELAFVEVQRVFIRLRHEKAIRIQASFRLRNDFLIHAQGQYIAIKMDDTLHEEAVHLTRKHQIFCNRVIRTLDAIQLACAVRVVRVFGVATPFVTSDKKLMAAAEDEGFLIINPELYP